MRLGALVVAGMLAVALAGCGSKPAPRLGRADAAPLIALANRIAAEDPCAQKRDLVTLRARAIALVNRHAVPARLQETFISGVNELAARSPVCSPPTPPPSADEQHGDHGKGHDKHGDGGDQG